jgi:hypothetical protein
VITVKHGNDILMAFFTNAGTTTSMTFPNHYLAIHTQDPTDLGLASTELSGGAYTRQQIHWTSAVNKTVSNNSQLIFNGLPAATATYWGIWNAATGGQVLFVIPIPTPIVVGSGGTIIVPTADVAIQFVT